MRASSTCMRMALRGFFTSCATPLVRRLMAERRSAVCSCRPIWRVASGSRRRTSMPPAALDSRNSTDSSAKPGSSGTRRLRKVRPVCTACARNSPSGVPGGKISLMVRPEQRRSRTAQKALHRTGRRQSAAVAREDQHRVFELFEQTLYVGLEIGELRVSAPQLLAQHVDFRSDDVEFVLLGLWGAPSPAPSRGTRNRRARSCRSYCPASPADAARS